jgi:hypothetical protein
MKNKICELNFEEITNVSGGCWETKEVWIPDNGPYGGHTRLMQVWCTEHYGCPHVGQGAPR